MDERLGGGGHVARLGKERTQGGRGIRAMSLGTRRRRIPTRPEVVTTARSGRQRGLTGAQARGRMMRLALDPIRWTRSEKWKSGYDAAASKSDDCLTKALRVDEAGISVLLSAFVIRPNTSRAPLWRDETEVSADWPCAPSPTLSLERAKPTLSSVAVLDRLVRPSSCHHSA